MGSTINYANIYIEHGRNTEEMNEALMAFPVYYMLYGRHGGVRKELRVKNPFSGRQKMVSVKIKPEIFKQNSYIFKNKILSLQSNKIPSFHKQPCET